MKNKNVLIKRDPLLSKCPECGELESLRRSHSRNLKERFFNHYTIYKLYRCKKCGWRGYLKTLTLSTFTFKVLLLYAGLIIITAIITYKVLSMFL